MKEAGFFVPDSFDKLPDMINQAIFSIGWRLVEGFTIQDPCNRTSWNLHESQVYTQLVMEGEIVETPEGETPQAWPSRALISWFGIRCQRSRHRWQVPSQDLKCIEITISHSESFLCLPFYCMKIPTQAQSAFTESHRLGFFADADNCRVTCVGANGLYLGQEAGHDQASWIFMAWRVCHSMLQCSSNLLKAFLCPCQQTSGTPGSLPTSSHLSLMIVERTVWDADHFDSFCVYIHGYIMLRIFDIS